MDQRESGDEINELARAFVKAILPDCFCEDNADELRAAGKIEIRFDRFGISCFEICKTEGILEDIDGSFNKHSVFVEVIPMICVSGNARTVSEILLGIGVNAFTIRRIRTGILTNTNPGVAFLL